VNTQDLKTRAHKLHLDGKNVTAIIEDIESAERYLCDIEDQLKALEGQ
jgi:hypothetical protein